MRLLAAAALALAACGSLPRPFQGTVAPELLDLGDGAGIWVQPLGGDVPGGPEAAAEIMARALQALEVPAATGSGNLASRALYGSASVSAADAEDRVVMLWELREPSGEVIGIHRAESLLPRGAWQTGDPAVIGPGIAAAAPAIAAMVQEEEVAQVAIPGFPGASLAILPLLDVPGDGATSLHAALEANLRAADLPLTDRPRGEDLLIRGTVALTPPKDGLQHISLDWALIKAADGSQIGQVAQESDIPAGSLDGPWGSVAEDISRAATAGLVDLLKQAGRRQTPPAI